MSKKTRTLVPWYRLRTNYSLSIRRFVYYCTSFFNFNFNCKSKWSERRKKKHTRNIECIALMWFGMNDRLLFGEALCHWLLCGEIVEANRIKHFIIVRNVIIAGTARRMCLCAHTLHIFDWWNSRGALFLNWKSIDLLSMLAETSDAANSIYAARPI